MRDYSRCQAAFSQSEKNFLSCAGDPTTFVRSLSSIVHMSYILFTLDHLSRTQLQKSIAAATAQVCQNYSQGLILITDEWDRIFRDMNPPEQVPGMVFYSLIISVHERIQANALCFVQHF